MTEQERANEYQRNLQIQANADYTKILPELSPSYLEEAHQRNEQKRKALEQKRKALERIKSEWESDNIKNYPILLDVSYGFKITQPMDNVVDSKWLPIDRKGESQQWKDDFFEALRYLDSESFAEGE